MVFNLFYAAKITKMLHTTNTFPKKKLHKNYNYALQLLQCCSSKTDSTKLKN